MTVDRDDVVPDVADSYVLLDDGQIIATVEPLCACKNICACDPGREFLKAHPLPRVPRGKRWQS